ncbi:MAG: hypothetical protein AAB592_00010 [Patescibacteria group bacterium]
MPLTNSTKIWIFIFFLSALVVGGGVFYSQQRTELYRGEIGGAGGLRDDLSGSDENLTKADAPAPAVTYTMTGPDLVNLEEADAIFTFTPPAPASSSFTLFVTIQNENTDVFTHQFPEESANFSWDGSMDENRPAPPFTYTAKLLINDSPVAEKTFEVIGNRAANTLINPVAGKFAGLVNQNRPTPQESLNAACGEEDGVYMPDNVQTLLEVSVDDIVETDTNYNNSPLQCITQENADTACAAKDQAKPLYDGETALCVVDPELDLTTLRSLFTADQLNQFCATATEGSLYVSEKITTTLEVPAEHITSANTSGAAIITVPCVTQTNMAAACAAADEDTPLYNQGTGTCAAVPPPPQVTLTIGAVSAEDRTQPLPASGEIELGRFNLTATVGELTVSSLTFSKSGSMSNVHTRTFRVLDSNSRELSSAELIENQNSASTLTFTFGTPLLVSPENPKTIILAGRFANLSENEGIRLALDLTRITTNADTVQGATATVATGTTTFATPPPPPPVNTNNTNNTNNTANTQTQSDNDRIAQLQTQLNQLLLMATSRSNANSNANSQDQLLVQQIAQLENDLIALNREAQANADDEDQNEDEDSSADTVLGLGDSGASSTQQTRGAASTQTTNQASQSGTSSTNNTQSVVTGQPTLQSSPRLASAPERGNTGPEVLIYFGAIAVAHLGNRLRKKIKNNNARK